jgi:hypothetical protein
MMKDSRQIAHQTVRECADVDSVDEPGACVECISIALEVTQREYHDALVRMDELSLMLGHALACTRIGWTDETTCEDALGPINQIAKQIGETIPDSIKITRPPSNRKRSL